MPTKQTLRLHLASLGQQLGRIRQWPLSSSKPQVEETQAGPSQVQGEQYVNNFISIATAEVRTGNSLKSEQVIQGKNAAQNELLLPGAWTLSGSVEKMEK